MSQPPTHDFPFPPGPLAEPPEQYAELGAGCPVSRVRLPSGDQAWYVTGYDEVQAALSDGRLSRAALREPGAPRVVTGPDFSDNPYNLLNQEGPDHKRLRRLISPAFTPRRAAALRGTVQRIADELIDDLVAAGPAGDLHRDYAAVLPVHVICALIDAPREDRPKIQLWTDRLVSITAHTPEERLSAREESAAYVAALIGQRRADPGDDLLSELIKAHDEGDRLTGQELVWLGINLLVAGHDTTVGAISRGLFALLRHPEQYRLLAKAPDDRGLLGHAVDELLRYAPPSDFGFIRVATEDLTIGGVDVAAGEGVIPAMHAAGRDSRHVTDPDILDLTRGDANHLAFGHGAHYCPGAGVARLELEIAFGSLARRLPELRLAVPEDQVRWIGGLLTLRPEVLPAEW
ncbi:cytochrome P450 [Actinacidiphila yeochonensis]|uniref:cytochrome P450 n=1 Tax=Actinacidiphila yeochonensis TaxID=89050 RepID=UPI000562EBB9|nr:cytochrome P450 [Actinacidiphila yeochonensis]